MGDIVFCKVKGRYYTHLVKAKGDRGVLIGNNHGRINGWTETSMLAYLEGIKAHE